MTRKDYVLIAATLAASRPFITAIDKFDQWSRDVDHIAAALARDNSRFDYSRFIAACKAGKV